MNWQEELHKIEWDELEACGSAEEIPQLITKLFTEDNHQEQNNTLNRLADLIYHQGTIYEATGYVISFFVEMLKSKFIKFKQEIFFTIIAIYDGEYRRYKELDAKLEIQKMSEDLVSFLNEDFIRNKSLYLYIFDNFPNFLKDFPEMAQVLE